MSRYISFSSGIRCDPMIGLALGGDITSPPTLHGADIQAVLGWGRKDNTRSARRYAVRHKLPYLALEDGFIGYLGHPARDKRRVSLIADDLGIYYDATAPSRLEKLLEAAAGIDAELKARAAALISRLRAANISKYNHGWAALPSMLKTPAQRPRVLVVDQTFGDKSISLGLASAESFKQMLVAAIRENPDADIFLKVHPDVIAGTKKGYFSVDNLPSEIKLISADIPTYDLLSAFSHVYVVTSQLGFEALVAGLKVTVFGVPFYAGWGLTDDRQPIPRRKARLDLESLVAAALIQYPRYVDPYLKRPAQVEDICDYLEAERALPRVHGGRVFALNFSLWKRSFVPQFLPHANALRFISRRALETIKWQPGDALITWGRKNDDLLADLPEGVAIWRMEDGFVRSVGLGVELERPSSLVLDGRGIYYDARKPSDLEWFLSNYSFSERQRARGEALARLLVEGRVTKYNVGGTVPDIAALAGGKPVHLVIGQVESDASIALGAEDISDNTGLLRAVRQRFPDAYIVYKPHPDVVSGHRASVVDKALADSGLADMWVDSGDVLPLIAASAQVHVMTSLTGFEALLRGAKVSVYGRPFYAGWGLTDDVCTFERRGRQLALGELVYALLCGYARYVAWPGGLSTIPEVVIENFAGQRAQTVVDRGGIFSIVKKNLRKAAFFLKAILR